MRLYRPLLCLLLVLLAFTVCASEPAVTPVAPGVWLSTERLPEGPWEVRALRIERQAPNVSLELALGMGQLRGVEKLTKLVARETDALNPVVAAVNADFFVMAPAPTAGLVCGLTVKDRELVMTARGNPAFLMMADGTPRLGVFDTTGTVTLPTGEVALAGLNQPLVKEGLGAYTGIYGWPVTGAVVVQVEGLPLRPEGVWTGTVSERVPAGQERLAREGEVLLQAKGAALASLAGLKPGDPVRLELRTPGLGGQVQMAAAGNQRLLQDGQIVPQPGEKDPRHPRTAVGYNEREIVFLTVDGRQAGWSVGMTYVELARLMQRYGCTEALNLDGGGSTTCWAAGEVVNKPSGGTERQIANAILVRCGE